MKILLVKTSSLGDIIHAFPTLRYLRGKFPEAQIDWVAERPFAELVAAHPDINTVFKVDTKAWRKRWFLPSSWREFKAFRNLVQQTTYDVLFDLQGNTKSGLISYFASAKTKVGLGPESYSERPNAWFTDLRFDPPRQGNVRLESLYLAQSYFKDTQTFSDHGVVLNLTVQQSEALQKVLSDPLLAKGPFIMVCPGSAWPNKQMSYQALERLLHHLRGHLHCRFVLIWGNQEERKIAESLHTSLPQASLILDRLPLPALQNLMARMQLVISMDSLPLHLAGTTSVPTFSIFGSSSSAKYRPEGRRHHSIQGACPYGRTFDRRCPILRTCPTGACIRSLTGDEVFEAIKQFYQ
ncbi:MAG: lipopolysaccharide heptosyltransferase I [Parachlamydia sp.]|nr:lipopolysaccharide heptosyltransferase I [Parachlamydia sp.]